MTSKSTLQLQMSQQNSGNTQLTASTNQTQNFDDSCNETFPRNFIDNHDDDLEDEDYTKTGHGLESPFITMAPPPPPPPPKRASSDAVGSVSTSGRTPVVRRISFGAIPGKGQKVPEMSTVSLDFLKEQGYTRGLIRALEMNKRKFPLRVWLVDNSQSMNKRDGHMIRSTGSSSGSKVARKSVDFVSCSRWQEMQQTVDYHSQMAAIIKSTTVFKLLNPPTVPGVAQQFSIAKPPSASAIPGVINTKGEPPSMLDLYHDLENAQTIMSKVIPCGHTPLNQCLHEIRDNIIQLLPKLQGTTTSALSSSSPSSSPKSKLTGTTTTKIATTNTTNTTNSTNTTNTNLVDHHDNNDNNNNNTRKNRQRRVAIVIATDGKPTDNTGRATPEATQELCATLLSLRELPVWIVVRLCTDEESVVSYWNNFDVEGLDIEVIDDFVSEAQEVYEHNKWLNYALPLHRMREMGFHDDIFDALDERTLNKDELVRFLGILFGRSTMKKAPSPIEQWDLFCKYVQDTSSKEYMQWNPITKRIEPWINIKHLTKMYIVKEPRRSSLLRRLMEPVSPMRSPRRSSISSQSRKSSLQRLTNLLKKKSKRNLLDLSNDEFGEENSVEMPLPSSLRRSNND